MAEQVHPYGPHFSRVRLEAAERLGRPELRTVAGAARELHIGVSTLYHYEDGTKRPSLEQLEQMADGYGVMVGDMLPSKAIRSGEVAGIVAPLMTLPAYARQMFIRQMSAFAEGLAATIDIAQTPSINMAIEGTNEVMRPSNGSSTGKTDELPEQEYGVSSTVTNVVSRRYPEQEAAAQPSHGKKARR